MLNLTALKKNKLNTSALEKGSSFTDNKLSFPQISFGTKTTTPQTIEQGSVSKFTSGVGSFFKQAPLGRVITAI